MIIITIYNTVCLFNFSWNNKNIKNLLVFYLNLVKIWLVEVNYLLGVLFFFRFFRLFIIWTAAAAAFGIRITARRTAWTTGRWWWRRRGRRRWTWAARTAWIFRLAVWTWRFWRTAAFVFTLLFFFNFLVVAFLTKRINFLF